MSFGGCNDRKIQREKKEAGYTVTEVISRQDQRPTKDPRERIYEARGCGGTDVSPTGWRQRSRLTSYSWRQVQLQSSSMEKGYIQRKIPVSTCSSPSFTPFRDSQTNFYACLYPWYCTEETQNMGQYFCKSSMSKLSLAVTFMLQYQTSLIINTLRSRGNISCGQSLNFPRYIYILSSCSLSPS